jgi:hypothetical protein
VVLSLLILETRGTGVVILAILFGLAFVLDGAMRIASVRVVRFKGWPFAVAGAIGELTLGAIVLESWLRATAENDVPGRFLASYAQETEAAGGCSIIRAPFAASSMRDRRGQSTAGNRRCRNETIMRHRAQ